MAKSERKYKNWFQLRSSFVSDALSLGWKRTKQHERKFITFLFLFDKQNDERLDLEIRQSRSVPHQWRSFISLKT